MRIESHSSKTNSALIAQHLVLCAGFCTMLLAIYSFADAQQPATISRIGYLSRSSGPGANEKTFHQSLRSLGYIEGQTVVFKSRFAHEKLDRLPELAADLVRVKVAIIVAGSGAATVQAAKRATKTIPIVMANVKTCRSSPHSCIQPSGWIPKTG